MATRESRTVVAALMLWIAAAAVGRAGARPANVRRGGSGAGAGAGWPGAAAVPGADGGRSAVVIAAVIFRAGRPAAGQGQGGTGAVEPGTPGRAVRVGARRALRRHGGERTVIDGRPTSRLPGVPGRRVRTTSLSGALARAAGGSG